MDEFQLPPPADKKPNPLYWVLGVFIAALLLAGIPTLIKPTKSDCGDGSCITPETEENCSQDCPEICIFTEEAAHSGEQRGEVDE